MNRFRPNLVVDGWDTPHTEDGAARLTIADTELAHTEDTIRCAITMVDQRTGRRSGPEPLRTLADYRRADGGGVAFGAYFEVRRAGKVSLGDEVVVSAGASPGAGTSSGVASSGTSRHSARTAEVPSSDR